LRRSSSDDHGAEYAH